MVDEIYVENAKIFIGPPAKTVDEGGELCGITKHLIYEFMSSEDINSDI